MKLPFRIIITELNIDNLAATFEISRIYSIFRYMPHVGKIGYSSINSIYLNPYSIFILCFIPFDFAIQIPWR